ncbi:putative protein TPRXL isoform X2 [Anthonomus grandis grandis]|uniref:putative protein TPRXL isoform X2 n=1 Tax=Anthonomus grandis grandis TaxID=2921223 RepID=UPI0021650613|nr:putative protein TPRXL isoform X2 [Anthonomus grandis grandis]
MEENGNNKGDKTPPPSAKSSKSQTAAAAIDTPPEALAEANSDAVEAVLQEPHMENQPEGAFPLEACGSEGEVEMDPLVLTDSPVASTSRCRTRRSHARSIPTPQSTTPPASSSSTPRTRKSATPPASASPTQRANTPSTSTTPPLPAVVNQHNGDDDDTDEDDEDASTNAQPGNDSSRFNLSLSLPPSSDAGSDGSGYLASLRMLSPRQTIRPLNDSHRLRGAPVTRSQSREAAAASAASTSQAQPRRRRRSNNTATSAVEPKRMRPAIDGIDGGVVGGAEEGAGGLGFMNFLRRGFRAGGAQPGPREPVPESPERDPSAGDGQHPGAREQDDEEARDAEPERRNHCTIM